MLIQKVYVITKGAYSDYHICTITADPELAKRLAKIYSDDFNDAEIEEYRLNECNKRQLYGVVFDKHGNIVKIKADEYEIQKEEGIDTWSERDDDITFWVYAKDIDHAQKIAQDKRAEYIARKENIV